MKIVNYKHNNIYILLIKYNKYKLISIICNCLSFCFYKIFIKQLGLVINYEYYFFRKNEFLLYIKIY